MIGIRALLAAAVLGLVLSGCAGSSGVQSGQMAATAPMLSVERFLHAANGQDLEAMARIFGTRSGPMQEEQGNPVSCGFRRLGSWIGLSARCMRREQIELRMNAIAMILRHDDFEILSESRVPGRRHPTIRIGVTLVQGERRYPDVPFLVVESSQGRWLVEEIGLERITTGR